MQTLRIEAAKVEFEYKQAEKAQEKNEKLEKNLQKQAHELEKFRKIAQDAPLIRKVRFLFRLVLNVHH